MTLGNMKFSSVMTDVTPINSNLAKCKIRVMYCGKNNNSTYFDEEMVIEKMIPTIYNTPIIGYMDDDDFTDHRPFGGVEGEQYTYAIGLIPESTEITWERYIENDGITEHKYLCCTGYLWKRFEKECKKILNDSSRHSMEITINDMLWEESIGAFNIVDAEFAGFCAIGVDPCFEGSKIGGVNSYSKLSLDFNLLKDEISKLNYEQSEVENLTDETGKVEVEEVEIEDEFEETEEVETEETDTVDEITEADETEEVLVDEVEVEEIVEETEEITEEEVVVEEVDETDYKLELENLQAEFDKINDELVKLREFKSNIEMEEKTGIVDTFKHRYSLEDSDIESVIANINTYSAKEVEDELCIIAFKKGASANYTEEKEKSKKTAILSNYENNESGTVGVKAILSRRK